MKMGTYETLCLQQITETKISPIFFANVIIYTEDFPDNPLESAASLRNAPPPLSPVWP